VSEQQARVVLSVDEWTKVVEAIRATARLRGDAYLLRIANQVEAQVADGRTPVCIDHKWVMSDPDGDGHFRTCCSACGVDGDG